VTLVISQATCSHCGHSSNRFTEYPREFAVAADDGSTRTVTESDDTFEAAEREGRLLRTDRAFCRDCGTDYEIRSVWAGLRPLGTRGGVALLTLSLLVGWLVDWLTRDPLVGTATGLLLFLGSLVAASFAMSHYLRWRYKDRGRATERGPGCPRCHGVRYATASNWGWPLICPQCSRRTYRVRGAGKS